MNICPHCEAEVEEGDETCHEMNEGRHYHLSCWHETGRLAWKVVKGVVYTVGRGKVYPMPTIVNKDWKFGIEEDIGVASSDDT